MKLIGSQLAYFLSETQARRNVVALLKYISFLTIVICVFSVMFHVLMLYEGREYSWVTGFYWTLTVMSTLGFGDITFHSDIGRLFSIVVLLTGIVLLMIMLPFVFISYFYAPWLEARVRLEAPRQAPEDARGHVIITCYDSVAPGLIERLKAHEIPYFVLEPNPTVAARMHQDGLSVVTGEIDARTTYEALRVSTARLVVANSSDTVNTNITLTIREVAPEVPILAIAEDEDSVDILGLAGANHVLPLKIRLGEHLANRINARHAQAHVVGAYHSLQIAEFPVHSTPLSGKRLRDIGLRESLGINILAVWDRGKLLRVDPDLRLTDQSVVVVAGTPDQLLALNSFLVIYDTNYNPVLIIGGGKVGCATAHALKRQGIPVHLVECNEALSDRLKLVPDQLFVGDAAEREVLLKAGLEQAPSVLLTTNDDAMNIYLAVYCRRLNPHLRIVSRITHERNMEAIHRAGADFVLSYATLGAEAIFSTLMARSLVLVGEGVNLFNVPIPPSLAGKTLGESALATRCGLNVIAIRQGEQMISSPVGATSIPGSGELIMLGTPEQYQRFVELYG